VRAVVAALVVLALCVVPAASAKFKLGLTVDDVTPAVGQPLTAVLRAGVALDYDLKLIVVAPGKSWYDVVGVVTGDSKIAKANIPVDGFEVPVTRISPSRWRAIVRFPRAGRWRLIIPNGAPEGFMIPPPVMRTIVVRPRVTNQCPLNALPLRRSDLPALRRFGLAVAPHGVQHTRSGTIDYRDAHARAGFPTFYTGYVRSACPKLAARRIMARTADVSISYPHVNWSASLSYSVFLVARTPHGFVAWAQMH
jgi:hypothetical protein